MLNFILLGYCVALCRRKTQKFDVFWNSAIPGVTNWRCTAKFERGYKTTNFPQSKVVEIVSERRRHQGEIMRTNSILHKREVTSMTDKQTNKKSVFWRRAKSEPYQNRHGDRGPHSKHVLVPRKHFVV